MERIKVSAESPKLTPAQVEHIIAGGVIYADQLDLEDDPSEILCVLCGPGTDHLTKDCPY